MTLFELVRIHQSLLSGLLDLAGVFLDFPSDGSMCMSNGHPYKSKPRAYKSIMSTAIFKDILCAFDLPPEFAIEKPKQ